MQQASRKQSEIMMERQPVPPQVNIYNRNFYLRSAEMGLKRAQYQQQIKQLSNKPKISVSSYNILVQKLQSTLLKSFIKNCDKIVRQGQNVSLQKTMVNFTQLQNIMHEMCEIPTHNNQQEVKNLELFLGQLWLVLGRYKIQSQIKANLLYTTLRIFLDPYNLNSKQIIEMLNNMEEFSRANQYKAIFQQQMSAQIKQQLLTIHQIIKLCRMIKVSKCSSAKPQKLKVVNNNLSFKPQINKRSEYLAEQSLKKYLQANQTALNRTLDPQIGMKNSQFQNDLSRYLSDNSNNITSEQNFKYFTKPCYHDILFRRRLGKDQMIHKQRSKSKQQSIFTSKVSRTARPEQIKQIVNNLYIVKKRAQDTDFIRRDQQKQLKQCTFSPKINKNFQNSRKSVSPTIVKGYDKQVLRLQKGRQQKERKKQAYENLGRVKNFGRNYSKSPNKNIAPSFIDRDTPKLILQINIDGQRVEKLALKGNQNPHLVSKKFVIKHGLQQQMVQVLQALVQEQLQKI